MFRYQFVSNLRFFIRISTIPIFLKLSLTILQSLCKVVVCMRMVSLSCTCLEINAFFQEWELPGIVVLIKACPVVEDVRFVMNSKHEKVTMECDIL